MRKTLRCVVFLACVAAGCSNSTPDSIEVATTADSIPSSEAGLDSLTGELSYEVVARYPHLVTSFTQGLEFLDDGRLVESVGGYGESGRAVVDLDTGTHLEFAPVDESLFSEGITQVGDALIQISWVSEVAIVADSETLVERRRLSYEGEGWGLCFDGQQLAMSDGSERLAFRDPTTFDLLRQIDVTARENGLVGQLNELECVEGRVWANVYFENHIVAINSETGEVEAWIDLEALVPDGIDEESVLNGIAYRPETGTLFVTGKNWPELFELRLSAS